MTIKRSLSFVFCLLSSAFLFPISGHADTLIRDAELEDTLRQFGDPIFVTAGLQPDAVSMYIVGDDMINSYVAGGQNIFIYTGLLLACDDPTMLLGVLAHETGHIAGGHLARGAEDLKDAAIGQIFGFVLGATVAAVGNSAAGMGVIAGTQNVIGRKVLSYSRSHEEGADQAALRYLDALHISASGMIEVFNVLNRNQLRSFGSPDPYLMTHPLSTTRIAYVREHVETSGIAPGQHPKSLDAPWVRLKAKLYAFLNIPPKTFARYPASDTSVAARMARAIAWYKMPDFEHANTEMSRLLKDYPKDAFLYDLNGQIQFEHGHVREALAAYKQASLLKPNSPLILTSLGQAQLAAGEAAAAITSLTQATALDTTNAGTWQLLATAYDKQGNKGMSALAMAEQSLVEDKPAGALQQANLALKSLSGGSPSALRAEDIKRVAEDMKRKEKENR